MATIIFVEIDEVTSLSLDFISLVADSIVKVKLKQVLEKQP